MTGRLPLTPPGRFPSIDETNLRHAPLQQSLVRAILAVMPAYVIADVDVTDPERYRDYTTHTPASIARHGGRWVVRGGPTQVLEGDWNPGRIVVIEFPDVNAALAWFNSDDYQELAQIRREASTARILVAEGAQ